jgi:hypothetical protein
MNYRFFIAVLVFAAAALLPLPIMAESVFLKDGSIIDGTVESENDNQVVLKLANDTKKEISRSNILRVAYSDEHKTKMFIYKKDNTIVEGYIVDVNRDKYTLRMNLTSNDEIQIPKKLVTAVSERRLDSGAAEQIYPKSASTYYITGFLVPGLGQIYADHNVKGILLLGSITGAALFTYFTWTLNQAQKTSAVTSLSSNTKYGLAGMAGLYVLNWIDILFITSFEEKTAALYVPKKGFSMSVCSIDDSTRTRWRTGAGLAFSYGF